MISLGWLDAMTACGLDEAEQLRLIRELLAIRARRRAARAAAKLNNHDMADVRGGANAALTHDTAVVIQAPQRHGHVHNGSHKTVARAALLRQPRLTPAARVIGEQLVEHADAAGRSFWSLGRMARDSGVSPRTASRAVQQLAAFGLLGVVVHGAGRTNSYRLDWAALARVAAGVPAKLNNHAKAAPITTAVTANHDSGVAEILSPNPESESVPVASHRARAAPDWQLPLMVPIHGGRGTAAAQGSPAYGAAGQRLWDAIGRHGAAGEHDLRRQLLDLVSGDPGLAARATFAELRQPGSGLGVLLAATGPPAQAAGG
jgi:AraC-like DNA-binding protein